MRAATSHRQSVTASPPLTRPSWTCVSCLAAQLSRANLPALHALLSCRHAIATTLGASSYAAHRLTHDRMEGSPDAVQAALSGLSERLRPKAELELAILQQSKLEFGAGGRRRSGAQTHARSLSQGTRRGARHDTFKSGDI